ncbi:MULTISPECIES: hypothetical protein [unclassified Microbacterium]|uniref:hypothetical protein n=1 Tax=unclassified Microbacterium TaxID=2609290 RepID=UPI003648F9E6
MTNSPRRFKALTNTALALTAAFLLVGVALTVYALVAVERGSSSFNAALMWGRASLILGVVIGVAAILVRRSLARRLPPPEQVKD